MRLSLTGGRAAPRGGGGVVIPQRLRPWVVSVVDRLDRRLHRNAPHALWIECPPSADARPRYGYGRPRHQRLSAIIGRHDDTYRAELETIGELSEDLLRIPVDPGDVHQPHWSNGWLPGLDLASLYAYVRTRRPARYAEVGSGNSTSVVAHARRDGSLSTEITSIDPSPRRDIDALCDRVVREPLELVDLDVFTELESGDVLFIDGSHRVFMNSDAVVAYLDVLPELQDGVLVGIHDVLWPYDYLPGWSQYWWNEQYLVAALLLAEPSWLELRLPCFYASRHPDLRRVLDPLWSDPRLAAVAPWGTAFWFGIGRPAAA
jgi:hypothetical protein